MRSKFIACLEAIINPWDSHEKMAAMNEEFKRLNSLPKTNAFMCGVIRDGKQVVLVYATEPDHSLN
ncbi:hypothetical protein [Pseudomonas sp. LS-2]|uniref:hypothetical protein n=1 Tax=Pseudomonas sp. LS-2 TaxID=2315859 RepID=UPI001058772D|nr:hypothetical protein [Pseudomonas sp. LS-2]